MKIYFMDTQIYTFNTPKTVIIYLKRKRLKWRREDTERERKHFRIYVYLNVLKFKITRFRSHFHSLFCRRSCSSRTHKHSGSILKVNTHKICDKKFITSYLFFTSNALVSMWPCELWISFLFSSHFFTFVIFLSFVGVGYFYLFRFSSLRKINEFILKEIQKEEGEMHADTHTQLGSIWKTQASKYSLIQCRQLVQHHSVYVCFYSKKKFNEYEYNQLLKIYSS